MAFWQKTLKNRQKGFQNQQQNGHFDERWSFRQKRGQSQQQNAHFEIRLPGQLKG